MMAAQDHESGLNRSRLPVGLREQIMAALQRGDDTYDDVLDAVEAFWPVPESIEWRIVTSRPDQTWAETEDHESERLARESAAEEQERTPGAVVSIEYREVGDWQAVTA
jgi:hypothetical protein